MTNLPSNEARAAEDINFLAVNIEGGGRNVDQFLGSDFHLPQGAGKTYGAAGSLPQYAEAGDTIGLSTEGRIVATATFLGVDTRDSRIEHIPTRQPDGTERCEDRGPGYVLLLEPDSWKRVDVVDPASSRGYRYYHYDGERLEWIRVTGLRRPSSGRGSGATGTWSTAPVLHCQICFSTPCVCED